MFRHARSPHADLKVRDAIRKGRKVQIRYHNEASEVTERVIWPLGVAYFEATRNVIAWCELREAFRYFRTDRIEDISYLDQRYPGRRISCGDFSASRQARPQSWRQRK